MAGRRTPKIKRVGNGKKIPVDGEKTVRAVGCAANKKKNWFGFCRDQQGKGTYVPVEQIGSRRGRRKGPS